MIDDATTSGSSRGPEGAGLTNDRGAPLIASSLTATEVDGAPDVHRASAGRFARAAAGGAVAGMAGAIAMSGLLMLPAQRIGLLGTQPPRRMSDRALAALRLGHRPSERERQIGTSVVHLAVGAAGGALIGIVREVTDRRGPGMLVGAAVGGGLWAANYIALAPALELFPPPHRDRPGRPPVMFAAHLLYGAVTAAVLDATVLRARRRQRATVSQVDRDDRFGQVDGFADRRGDPASRERFLEDDRRRRHLTVRQELLAVAQVARPPVPAASGALVRQTRSGRRGMTTSVSRSAIWPANDLTISSPPRRRPPPAPYSRAAAASSR